jgi:hypothetical protein
MEAGDPTDSPKDTHLEYQRVLGVPTALINLYPEVCQHLQTPMRPVAIEEVIQRQDVGSNPEMEPLPFGILSNANPAVKVGAIILMDGVTIDTAEPTFGIRQPLEPRVLRPELCISAVTWHKVPVHSLCSLTPTCDSRRIGGEVQMGGGNCQCSSKVEPKMIFMGHEISSFHAPVVSSFFVLFKNLVSS